MSETRLNLYPGDTLIVKVHSERLGPIHAMKGPTDAASLAGWTQIRGDRVYNPPMELTGPGREKNDEMTTQTTGAGLMQNGYTHWRLPVK